MNYLQCTLIFITQLYQEVASNFISNPGNFISNPGNFISKAWNFTFSAFYVLGMDFIFSA